MGLEKLELSTRAQNCLLRDSRYGGLGIRTVAELMRMTEAELLSVRNFGRVSLAEVKTALAEIGLERIAAVPLRCPHCPHCRQSRTLGELL